MKEKEAADFLRDKGYGVIPPGEWRIDMEESFFELWDKVKDYTLTSPERGYALYKAVEYICRNSLPGDFAECGVFRGGSCMLIALAVMKFSPEPRTIHLYDTFTGMPEPGEEDVLAWSGIKVGERIAEARGKGDEEYCRWESGIEEVKNNLFCTGYPPEKLIFHPGDVLETLKGGLPEKLALLRLDTDWYESTRCELERLYPVLIPGGILIIDDYGHFLGARKAVDEYFSNKCVRPFLARMDYTGRTAVKSLL